MGMTWFDVLKAARKVGSREETEAGKHFLAAIPFTAAQLAAQARFKATERSRSTDIAAGWISKLVRWGYLRRVPPPNDTPQGEKGGRPEGWYELTRWGLIKHAPQRKFWEAFKPQKAKMSLPKKAAANPED